jgi:hypothetical protein
MRREDMWLAVPAERHTVTYRSLSFRLLSRIGASIEWYLRRPCRQFPAPLYSLIDSDDPELRAEVLQRAKSCPFRLDTFTTELLKMHPDFDGAAFECKLKCNAIKGPTDISQLEVKNGQLRKDAVTRVQTHKVSVPDLGASWLLRTVSKSDEPACGEVGAAADKPNQKARVVLCTYIHE